MTDAPAKCAKCKPDPMMLAAALDYARQGTPVFPCRPVDKEVRGKILKVKSPLTPRGFKDATTFAVAIESWWEGSPDALIGIPQGAASGMFTIDLEGSGKPGIEPD